MQFISGLFGDSGNTVLTMIFALAAVIVLILLVVWLLKVVMNVSSNGVRGRNRRLAVVDTLVVDQKRQLMIIRRDNVEHVILTGGGQDIVVETGIPVVEPPAAIPARKTLPAAPLQAPVKRAVAPAGPPQAPETARPVPAAAAPIPKGEPDTLLKQLQQSGHSGERKTRVSLRRTGLMRQPNAQVSNQTGQNPDISTVTPADSANETSKGEISEGVALEHESGNEANRG